jgi:hypothetical protein
VGRIPQWPNDDQEEPRGLGGCTSGQEGREDLAGLDVLELVQNLTENAERRGHDTAMGMKSHELGSDVHESLAYRTGSSLPGGTRVHSLSEDLGLEVAHDGAPQRGGEPELFDKEDDATPLACSLTSRESVC